ncbi:aspartyl-tRNA(Asn)/glutamyl-tRNA(Gln) amidotransferase subunit A [Polaromonas sp. OV174]|uniref:amidase n=1 Tax=Polaromonas sp. OV174 TaxID=1855300 RepID=UPI0008E5FBD4|nr:amidase [Polaromonas sp. OV174]SFC58894.1 aspartyl-tRNA(Asn)/glutamyl-tRNA(Gln) amidotransferase subunit A [Polaromonas sp. OV174]
MNPQPELWRLSAVELARRYRDGSLTPRAVAQACLARLDVVNPQLNAVVARRDAALLQEADDATARFAAGKALSMLDGIVLTIKDNLLTQDQPATWGSRALREHRPASDELPVARLRTAGALILGKTNVPEFTLEGYTSNPVFGTTRNPWNPSLTPGGSSGGAVAGVAAGIAPLALGTDGGGSIRRPASHCGVVGLKPSIGAIARGQGLPTLLLDFEVVGPMGRSVADVKLLFDVLRGPQAVDRQSLAAEAARGKPRRGSLRVLYVPTLDGAPVDPEIAANCAQAARRLADLGHSVSEGVMPLDLAFMATTWPVVGQVGLAHLFETHPQWREGASAKYLEMAGQGAAQPAARLWEILETVAQLRSDCARLFREIDVLITPAAAALPWPADEAFPPAIAGQTVGPRGHAVFTGWVNAAGLPALAVPAQPSSSGLPIGVQMIAGYGADELLLELGLAYEASAPWADRWPLL